MAVLSMKQLLEAGVHFGHQTRRWNPKMKPYIFTVVSSCSLGPRNRPKTQLLKKQLVPVNTMSTIVGWVVL